jgi:hypothetical protein
MGYWKSFQLFCQINDLNPDARSSHEAFHRGSVIEAIEISDNRDLTWSDIEALTGGRIGTFSLACPYCGPDKPWSTRLRVERRSFAFARWSCFYCGRSGGARAEGPIDPEKEAEAQRAAAAWDREQRAERTDAALQWWKEAIPLRGTPAERYLQRRAIHEFPANVDDVLRWHPACAFGGRARVGCMIALYRDVRTDAPVAIHRTYVTGAGPAPRMSLGPIAGAMVKLWPLAGELLVVGEGIETVLSAAAMRWRGTPLQPAWAATVANNVAGLPLIRGVKRLIILGDNDETGTGQLKALQAYHRWREAGRDALILMPNKVGTDFNDIARGRHHGS